MLHHIPKLPFKPVLPKHSLGLVYLPTKNWVVKKPFHVGVSRPGLHLHCFSQKSPFFSSVHHCGLCLDDFESNKNPGKLHPERYKLGSIKGPVIS